MKKRKFFSYLLMGLVTLGTAGTISSCKDYDDDIDNLQDQINKAALKSDVDALTTRLTAAEQSASNALTTAQAAATQSDLAAVKTIADNAASGLATLTSRVASAEDNVQKAQAAAEAAQATADKAQALADSLQKVGATKADVEAARAAAKVLSDAAQTAAEKAQATADQAVKDAKAASDKVTDAIAAQDNVNKDLRSRVAALEQSYVTAAVLKDSLKNINDRIDLLQGGNGEAVKKLQNTVSDYKTAVDELYSAVTSVELVASYSYYNGQGRTLGWAGDYIPLDMTHGLIGETSTFGDEAYAKSDPTIPYTKGADVKDPKGIIVRVNPTNADLTKGVTIKLLDSEGNDLDDYVTVGTPERYKGLITRASNNTGLWTIPVSVHNGLDNETFNNHVADPNDANKHILYAVAIKNTTDTIGRYVVSTYDVAPSYKDYKPATTFDFEVNGTNIKDIKNRYTTDGSVLAENGETANNKEYKWNASSDKAPKATFDASKDASVVVDAKADGDDARYSKSLLQVAVGKPFSLKAFVGNDKIALDYYYVVLDKDNAIESAPSEWNAWNSYKYDGLYKTVKADSVLNITINSDEANGDIIGFRVYAVNRDGSLADPDGRAFYVAVGDVVTNDINGKVVADKQTPNTDTLNIKVQSGVNYGEWTLKNADDKTVFPEEAPTFTAKYLDKDGKPTTDIAKASQVYFECSDISKMVDGSKAILTLDGTKSVGTGTSTIKAQTITATYTKVLPTAFPASISFRPMQEVNKDTWNAQEGSGYFVLYMKPENGWTVDNISDKGVTNLKNVFYNLDDKVEFTFANAAYKNGNKKDGLVVNKSVLSGNAINITEGVDFIYNTEGVAKDNWHAVTVDYNYGNLSLTKNADGSYTNKPVTASWNKTLYAQFACWETASTYKWGAYDANVAADKSADGKAHKKGESKKPSLQWKAVPSTATANVATDIDVTNSYNADFFGGTLGSLLTSKYLQIDTEKAPVLKYGNQENPYFKVAYGSGTELTFTQQNVQAENAPRADHEETLVIYVKDAFGHSTPISLGVTVKKPTTNAKKH